MNGIGIENGCDNATLWILRIEPGPGFGNWTLDPGNWNLLSIEQVGQFAKLPSGSGRLVSGPVVWYDTDLIVERWG
jgi:hypothetical protein